MRKTRRKLSRRRRQRGGGRLWWILVSALAIAQGAKAEDPSLRALAKNWWTVGGWDNSKAFADGLLAAVPGLPIPPLDSTPQTPALWAPPATKSDDLVDVVEPYLLEEGKRYKVTVNVSPAEPGSIEGMTPDIQTGDILVYVGSHKTERGSPIRMYKVQRTSDLGTGGDPKRIYDIPADAVTLTPVETGGRRRKHKTLRRKK